MTLSEISKLAADKIGADQELVWGIANALVTTMIDEMYRGNDLKIKGLGTFHWVDVPSRPMPQGLVSPGKKLRFRPSKWFRHRRSDHV